MDERGPVPVAERGEDGSVVAHAASAAEMKLIGARLAPLLAAGDTVLLGGELGAGKTTLTQGLAAALGVREPVTSPTFVLLHSYKTAAGWDLLHADVWRLEHLHEVIDLALPELLEEGAAAVVEWGEMAAPALAPDWLRVTISYEAGSYEAGSYEAGSYEAGTYEATVGSGHDGGPSGEAGWGEANRAGASGVRRVVFRACGRSWQGRMAGLAKSLASSAR